MTNRVIDYKSKDYKAGYKNWKKFYKEKYEWEIDGLKQEWSKIITSLRMDLADLEKGSKVWFITLWIILLISVVWNVIQFIYL